MFQKKFKKVDHIDSCKIIVLEVKKIVLFAPCRTRLTDFESSWLETFALYKVQIFDIMLGN
jgi:hypothetical protein